MKSSASTSLNSAKDVAELGRLATIVLDELQSIINGNIDFNNNCTLQIIPLISFGAANTEIVVQHNLGRVPTGYIVIGVNTNSIIYRTNGKSYTTTQIFLNASVACQTGLLIF